MLGLNVIPRLKQFKILCLVLLTLRQETEIRSAVKPQSAEAPGPESEIPSAFETKCPEAVPCSSFARQPHDTLGNLCKLQSKTTGLTWPKLCSSKIIHEQQYKHGRLSFSQASVKYLIRRKLGMFRIPFKIQNLFFP